MKKTLTSIAFAAVALAASVGAQANVVRATLDFETPIDGSPFLTYAGTPLLGNGDEFYQPGIAGHTMFFDPFSNSALAQPGDLVGAMITGTDSCSGVQCPANNASTYVGVVDDAVLLFGANDGFRFSIKSFKASFIGNTDPVAATPGFVRLQGMRNGVSTTATFALTGLDANNNLNFATIDTGAFGNIEWDYVYAYGFACPAPGSPGSPGTCTAFGTDRAQFALDDVVIEHVPEPGSLALLAVAGLAAGRVTRRRAA
ncbi:NF038120 family PEP-CTERM protein [Roseateles sp. NT4]|uniref:NF038120 family PEP-CTERM protein n=1 Tax=Roseateles sp. NT4 TaxID=3453715 RepID=UPI003EEFBF6B